MRDKACTEHPTDQEPHEAAAICQIPHRDPEALPASWHGFRFDERGNLITRSGYKCSPNYLEGMLWLAGCYRFEILKHLIRSDEAPGALRPLLETADMDPSGEIKPTRLQLVEDQEQFGGDTLETPRSVLDDRREASQVAQRTPDQDQEHAGEERRRQTSAAIEPPLQRLRRAAAQITITSRALEAPLAGEHAPQRALGDHPLL